MYAKGKNFPKNSWCQKLFLKWINLCRLSRSEKNAVLILCVAYTRTGIEATVPHSYSYDGHEFL